MKIPHLAPLLLAATLALAACGDKRDSESAYGGEGNLPGGDQLDTGIPPNRPAGDFNPDRDVNYQALAGDTVHFAFDSTTIAASERGKLEEVSHWLESHPGQPLFLAGHADKRGTPEYNRALGERRALAVREYLVGLGAKPSLLYTNSYGADRPAAEGDTEDDYAQNRRVEIGVVIQH